MPIQEKIMICGSKRTECWVYLSTVITKVMEVILETMVAVVMKKEELALVG
jgi:hypothetical protein